jgi:hypothetical protein
MDIETLEINLLKASEIKDNDIILVKINNEQKKNLKKEDVQDLYKKINEIVKKNITIYFFPDNLSINIIKNYIKEVEKENENIPNE